MSKHGLDAVAVGVAYRYNATILGVVDGDTFDAMVDLGFGVFRKERFRVYGINAPERGKLGWDRAKEDLSNLLAGKSTKRIATFRDHRDKYGRYVADVIVVNHNGFASWLSDAMVQRGNVVEYMQ